MLYRFPGLSGPADELDGAPGSSSSRKAKSQKGVPRQGEEHCEAGRGGMTRGAGTGVGRGVADEK